MEKASVMILAILNSASCLLIILNLDVVILMGDFKPNVVFVTVLVIVGGKRQSLIFLIYYVHSANVLKPIDGVLF